MLMNIQGFHIVRCSRLDTTLYDKVCQSLTAGGQFFLWVLRFPLSIKLTATYITDIFLKVALNTIILTPKTRCSRHIKLQYSFRLNKFNQMKIEHFHFGNKLP